MKFNWGTGIVIFIILFVMGIGSMVYISFQQDINLVHKDYYPRGIDHQSMIEKVENVNKLKGEVKVTLDHDQIEVSFPDDFQFDEIEGGILLYRPSDFNEDLSFPIQVSALGIQHISTKKLQKGKYIVKVEWAYGETEYYIEKPVHVK